LDQFLAAFVLVMTGRFHRRGLILRMGGENENGAGTL
jgi:hypothetical protein